MNPGMLAWGSKYNIFYLDTSTYYWEWIILLQVGCNLLQSQDMSAAESLGQKHPYDVGDDDNDDGGGKRPASSSSAGPWNRGKRRKKIHAG